MENAFPNRIRSIALPTTGYVISYAVSISAEGIEKVIENVVWNHLLGQGFKVTSFSGEMAEEKLCFRAAFLVL